MLVKEFCALISESNQEIHVNEYIGGNHTGRQYILPTHCMDYQGYVPDDVWDAEISSITPRYGCISIKAEKRGGSRYGKNEKAAKHT